MKTLHVTTRSQLLTTLTAAHEMLEAAIDLRVSVSQPFTPPQLRALKALVSLVIETQDADLQKLKDFSLQFFTEQDAAQAMQPLPNPPRIASGQPF